MAGPTEDRYRGDAGRAYQEQKRALPLNAFPWVARLRAEKFQAHIRANDHVIELGAGYGWNLAELKCARRVAIDLEDFLPAELKKGGVEFLECSSMLPARSFDSVICHHVLEHVESPLQMLAEIRRLLRPTGTLLLNVPFEKESRYRHFNPKEPNHHLYSWNVQTLGNLTADAGFNIQFAGVGEFGYDRAAAQLAVRLRGGERVFRILRRAAHLYRPALEVRIVAKPGASN